MRIVRTIVGTPRTLGERALYARTKRGLTARQISGVLSSTVSRIENGVGDVSLSGIVCLARVLGVSLDWLVLGKGPTPKFSGGTPDGK